ncbi:MAG: CopD family protein [Chitinophagales bacterium]|nr:CopD family protein [Chitinophagales bacterium]
MQTADWYAVAKALHLIGVVSWMAGIFYLVRILVYHAMAMDETGATREILCRQYNLMEWKAYKIIIRPAVVISWSFGTMMLTIQPAWLQQPWMHVKLAFLLILTLYTHGLQSHIRKLEQDTSTRSHLFYRAWNEVPTLAMVPIIFLAVFKDRIHFISLLIGMLVFTGLIALGIYKANKK